MGIVGPDGRSVASVKAEALEGGARCLFCAVRQRVVAETTFLPEVVTPSSLVGGLVAEGLYAGLKVLAEVLSGSGLDPEKTAEVVCAAASPCEDCGAVCAAVEVSGRAKEAVEVAVGNIRAASVFVVGRSGGGGGPKVGP